MLSPYLRREVMPGPGGLVKPPLRNSKVALLSASSLLIKGPVFAC